jgi:hypothetical protein
MAKDGIAAWSANCKSCGVVIHRRAARGPFPTKCVGCCKNPGRYLGSSGSDVATCCDCGVVRQSRGGPKLTASRCRACAARVAAANRYARLGEQARVSAREYVVAYRRRNGVRPASLANQERSEKSKALRSAICQGCNQPFTAKALDRLKFCSVQCAAIVKRVERFPFTRVWFANCNVCSEPFSSPHARLSCSELCAQKHGRAKALARVASKVASRPPRHCAHCNTEFKADHASIIYCGKRCSKKAQGGKDHRDRAKRYGVEYEPINRIALFERDAWKCQVCGVKTPKRLMGTYKPNAPEMDHRVPLSKGGPLTWANVQCCCRSCNADKGADRIVGQMPLFADPRGGGGKKASAFA